MQVQSNHQCLQMIFRELKPKDLANSSVVCKLWNALIADEDFIETILFRDFTIKMITAHDHADNFFRMFMSLHRSHWNMERGHYQQTTVQKNKFLRQEDEITPDKKHAVILNPIENTFDIVVLGYDENRITQHPHAAPIVAVRILNNNLAISASDDRVMKVWDLSSYSCKRTIEENTEGLVGLEIIHTKDVILTASKDGKITQWSTDLQPLRVIQTNFTQLTSMAVRPDEKVMVISALGEKLNESYLQLWDVNELKPLKTIHFPAGISHHEFIIGSLTTTTSPIDRVLFSNDGSKILLKSSDFNLFSPFVVTLDFTPLPVVPVSNDPEADGDSLCL